MTNSGAVLILSTYPIAEPRHGGQVRLLNIKRVFEEAGWPVVSVAVYPQESYAKAQTGRCDIPFPVDSPYRLFEGRNIPFVTDLLSGDFAAAEDGGLPAVLAQMPPRVAIIHVEQPWLWPLVEKLRACPSCASAVVVYGSQNIEGPLKQSIFDDYGIEDAGQIIEAIGALERQAARQADLTLAVTGEDLQALKDWGARRTVLAPNGIEPWKADEAALARWRERLPRFPWLLYVASAHPPNFTKFTDMLGESLACLPPTSRLVVAGSVSEHIYRVMSATKWSHLNSSRVQRLFTLPDTDLAAVKSLAHGFVLPIPYGGGSNIKTAEALYSGAYVVGTRAAFRGYEDFLDLPEVRVADDPKSFQRSIREVIVQPRPPQPREGTQGYVRRDGLTWRACLASLPSLVAGFRHKEGAL